MEIVSDKCNRCETELIQEELKDPEVLGLGGKE